MAQNAKRDAARQELERLLKGLDFYRGWKIARIKVIKGTVTQNDLDEIVEPSASFLEHFDMAKGQYAQVLSAVQQWYSVTYSELCYLAQDGPAAVAEDIRQFFNDFRNTVGFDFKSEAGLIGRTITQVLKRGRISTDAEYAMLKELESDVDQTILGGPDLILVSAMLRDFEKR